MGSDLARVSYDPQRQYRSVVAQQGRVTLEADVNEASRIAAEALRWETIDLVGPAATPDDGYKVGINANGEVEIGIGTLYLGGWRLHLDTPVPLNAQPDWRDMPAFQLGNGVSLVALLATEQSVCAVEDTALREVALGGPDTAARTRLMQHFLRLPAGGTTCAEATAALIKLLATDGVTLDPATNQLNSSARLEVGFTQPPTPPDPCEPTATGGYLGADNQMVRVTVISFDPQKRTGILTWGWNNASFLYRASVASPQTLSLSPMPLDTEHAPQQGQAVEILLTQADLGDGDLIASFSGQMAVLTQAYDPDTNLLTMPTGFTLPDSPHPLFVRLWQALVPFTADTPVPLDSVSGLTVSISMTALPSHVAARPFWRFAVRPDTPAIVYPRRFIEAPQPPSGPRQWLCGLAVIEGFGENSQILDDCRVTLGRECTCCAIVLGPEDVAAKGGLQAVLDGLGGAGTPATLSLRPGVYLLTEPLKFTSKHSFLTLEGCSSGAVLQPDANSLQAFRQGMASLQQTEGLALRRLVFEIPAVVAGTTGDTTLVAMSGFFATDCPSLTFEECQFVFAPPPNVLALGVGVLAAGNCPGLALRRNRFVCTTASGTAARAMFGIYSASTATLARLDDMEISGNLFANMGIAVASFAQLGLVRCYENRVRLCDGGFYFLSLGNNTLRALAEQAPKVETPIGDLPDLRPDTLLALAAKARTAIAAANPPEDAPKPSARAKTRAAATGVTALLDALEQDTIDAAAAIIPTAVLHVHDNDVELSAASGPIVVPGFAGLDMVLGARQPAQAMIGGNRFSTPDTSVAAATITLSPGQAVVTGNLFTQGFAQGTSAVPCLTVQVNSGEFVVMANVIHPQASILPNRPTPGPATTSWEFLNTTG